MGVSNESWADAAENALKEAAKTVRNIRELEIGKCAAVVKGDEIEEYRTTVKVTFIVERSLRSGLE